MQNASIDLLRTLTQTQRLQLYLALMGRINPIQAWNDLGIYRLSARINELRKTMNIETQTIEVENQFGEKCRVANYYLSSALCCIDKE